MTQKVKIKFKNMLIFVMTFALVAASVPLTGFAAAERHETQTEQETQEQEKESGTEKGTEGTTEKQETKAETEKKAEKGTEKESGAETESKAQTESGKQTEPEPGKKPEKKTAGKPKKLMLKVEGEATASVMAFPILTKSIMQKESGKDSRILTNWTWTGRRTADSGCMYRLTGTIRSIWGWMSRKMSATAS